MTESMSGINGGSSVMTTGFSSRLSAGRWPDQVIECRAVRERSNGISSWWEAVTESQHGTELLYGICEADTAMDTAGSDTWPAASSGSTIWI